jgi:hypothetical protein
MDQRQMQRALDRRNVTITEVDPVNSHIQAKDNLGTQMMINVVNKPTFFQLPVAGEVWQVSRQGSEWFLESRIDSPDVLVPLTDMKPGDARIEAPGDIYIGSNGLTSILGSTPKGWINVKEYPYGAKGDGVTDDTDAIIAALTAASFSGGIVFFPAGTYKVTRTITVPAVASGGPILKGVGPDNTNIYYTGSGYAFIFGNGIAGAASYYQGVEDMALTNVPGGIRLMGTQFFRLKRVKIQLRSGGNNVCVYIDGTNDTWYQFFADIQHCFFYGATQGSDIGVYLQGATSGNGANSNWIQNCWFGVFDSSVFIEGGDTNVISICEFDGSTNTGVKLRNRGGTGFNKILNNQFDGAITNVDIGTLCDYTQVIGNTGGRNYINNGRNTMEHSNFAPIWTGTGYFDAFNSVESVTAAATLAVNNYSGDIRGQRVDGTANITAITGVRPGSIIILNFTGTASGTGLTDGGNLKLNGNFVYTPDDTITLLTQDGTVFYEVTRSVN